MRQICVYNATQLKLSQASAQHTKHESAEAAVDIFIHCSTGQTDRLAGNWARIYGPFSCRPDTAAQNESVADSKLFRMDLLIESFPCRLIGYGYPRQQSSRAMRTDSIDDAYLQVAVSGLL